jgi:hemolysin D
MNAPENPPDNRKIVPMRRPPRLPSMDELDLQFLPAAQELLATPPSPIRMRLMMTICILFVTALLASWFGHIEIYAVAPGRLQPTGRSKVVQPLQAGKVRSIAVTNGSQVNAGDVLLELDPTESNAERDADAQQLDSLRAEIARRTAAINTATTRRLTPIPTIRFDADIAAGARNREQAVLNADISELRSSLNSLDSQIAENDTKKAALQSTIAEEEKLIATLKQRFEISDSVQKKGLESMSNVLDVRQSLDREVTTLANQKGELLKTDASTQSLRTNKENTIAKFIADNTQALATASGKRDDTAQNLVKTTAKVGYMRLTAPISGTVQELAVTTIGQVVSTGQQLMTIVPQAPLIEAEALVLNRDIGFVEDGQNAVLKIDAFPFTRYGVLPGKVVHISHDAVDSHEASMTSSASAAPVQPQSGAASPVPEVQNLVYPVTVSVDRATMLIDGKPIPLTPGMSATIEIQTGKRRVIEYFLSPLLQTVSEAAHER